MVVCSCSLLLVFQLSNYVLVGKQKDLLSKASAAQMLEYFRWLKLSSVRVIIQTPFHPNMS